MIKDVKMKFQKEKEDHYKEVKAHKDILVKVKKEQHASFNDIIHAVHVTFQISLNYVELLCLSLNISLQLLNSKEVVMEGDLVSQVE